MAIITKLRKLSWKPQGTLLENCSLGASGQITQLFMSFENLFFTLTILTKKKQYLLHDGESENLLHFAERSNLIECESFTWSYMKPRESVFYATELQETSIC